MVELLKDPDPHVRSAVTSSLANLAAQGGLYPDMSTK
jgi:HEAT repeat protein